MKKGFTLVELAIVLVIIGLLVGGVLQGQELIQQAKIRAVIRELESVNISVNAFRAKYGELPGDMRRAQAYWGTATDCAMSDVNLDAAPTCNGNGNGVIGLTLPASVGVEEYIYFWQHLQNSELIEKALSGNIQSGAVTTFVKRMKALDVGLTVPNGGHASSAGYMEPTINAGSKNYFMIAAYTQDGEDGIALGPILTPETAFNIDGKLDDGMPASGGVSTERTYISNTRCRDGSTPRQYDLANPDNTCALLVQAKF